jgi:hypothetical protein
MANVLYLRSYSADGKPIAMTLVSSMDESEQKGLFLAKILLHGSLFRILLFDSSFVRLHRNTKRRGPGA